MVIEDLISTGGSSLKAVEALKEAGCDVKGVLAIFTYGFDRATTAFAEANCSLETLTNYPELLQEAVKSEYISAEHLGSLQSWSKAPEAWLVQ